METRTETHIEAKEYSFIKKEILSLTGINLDFYKSQQMQRRLNTFLARSGQPNWSKFFVMTRANPDALNQLKDFLTINVSSFFRDAEKYKYLRSTIIPELLKTRRQLRIWSAGCSRGQEPYTLAMSLIEDTGVQSKHYILATDLDRGALNWAQAGGPYTKDDVANVPAPYLQRYFETRDKGVWVKDELRRRIKFQQHNLLADRFERDFDLIICRNVVIYFTGPVKDELYQRFTESLRPGGILFVGGTEIVSLAKEIGLETTGISFYRRKV